MKKLLFFSLEEWDDIWRRNQFVVSELLNRHEDLEVLWVNKAKDAWRDLSLLSLCCSKTQPIDGVNRLYVLSTAKLLPNRIGEALNIKVTSNQVKSAIHARGWTHWSTWVNDSVAAKIVRTTGKSDLLVYDITDDWLQSALPARNLERLNQDDDWLCRNADEVIVCSRDLLRTRTDKSRHITLIPNGVHFDLYKPEALNAQERPNEATGIHEPIAGYVGTLHEDRLDIELVLDAAKKAPHINFVFVGPNCLTNENTARLKSMPNVHLLGARPYKLVPSYLAWFNVCIVPHRVTPFTDSLDPLKLYEFMATGKPIVSTSCSGFRDMVPLVRIADATNFADQVEDAKNEDVKNSEARVSWASHHSWASRVEQIETLLGWNK